MSRYIERIEANPVIAAVRKPDDLEDALKSQATAVFLLHADIFNLAGLVSAIRERGKDVFVHFDFLEGLGRDSRAIDYLMQVIGPDGMITTKSSHVKYAREKGFFVIQRFFLIDSQSYDTMVKSVHALKPDMVEVMPAVMPSVIRRTCSRLPVPVIAGGLVESKEEMLDVLNAGAIGVSTGRKELWVL